MVPKVPANLPITFVKATRAESDEALLKSWLRSLGSPHTQRNFEVTARRFLAELPEGGLRCRHRRGRPRCPHRHERRPVGGLRPPVRASRQVASRLRPALGYTPFNAGATIKVRSDAGNRGANLAKRIISEVEVGLLIRAAPSKRDRVLLEVIYAGGLRVSETVGLTWADVLPRDDRVQLSILGKGGKVRQVLLPEIVSRSLLSLRGDAGANAIRLRQPQGRWPPHGARRQWHGQAHGSQGRHQRGGLAPLAAPRPRLACHRPRRLPARGADHPGPRQHRHHQWLSARPARHIERPAPRSWGVPSMKKISVQVA